MSLQFDESQDQTQLEYEAAECADYVFQKLSDGEDLTEENLAMWIVDHFSKVEM